MIILTGNTLGERQKELNTAVKEAASKNVDFDEVKDKTELSDVDKLFKIDLASKYMNIDYIIEVLKSGDSLYISRALKCTWMFDDEFTNIINVDNLQQNVFPVMSLRMKKKFLTTMAMYVKNPKRALAFYKYCSEMKLKNIALKFLLATSDEFKLEFMKNDSRELYELRYKNDFKHFIGTSFTLADAHIASLTYGSNKKAFYDISYMYSVSDVKYLDMLEKYMVYTDINVYYDETRLGLRMSKSILTKHKDRVLKKPLVYINFLNKTSIVKYSTPENAKVYLSGLFPKNVEAFWDCNFCTYYEHILNILPAEERFGFIKKEFIENYPGKSFEMELVFYTKKYYRFMTVEEKEKWALEQLASQKEILGIGKDYIWYQYVKFDKAFEEIKKLVMITKDVMTRADIVNILIKTAKTHRELEKLFKHYYDRHNNEMRHIKENFVDAVNRTHNVFEFDKECWLALDKIYQNLDLYDPIHYSNFKHGHAFIALIYNVIHDMDVHEGLQSFISSTMNFYSLKQNTDKLNKEQQEKVYQYLYTFYMDKINEFDAQPYGDPVKHQVRKYIYFILDLLRQYDRQKDDIPEVVLKFMKLDSAEFERHVLVRDPPKKLLKQDDLLKLLKKDAKLVVDNFPLLKATIENTYGFHLGQLLKKLRVYFSNDISKDYLKFFAELLKEKPLYPKVAMSATYGIFQLADDSTKIEFMKKHVPVDSKVNKVDLDSTLFQIQQAICATAFYSRPPVPLKTMLMYIKGDYVPYCLPLFNSYLANLPLPQCIEFVEAIINTPLSIQKHGIRLAFSCFNAEYLRKLLLYVWKKTKNVSLRLIIYKALYHKIVEEDERAQTALFETLTSFTSTLHQDDDKELFALPLHGALPKHFISDYMDTFWKVVSSLPQNNMNRERTTRMLQYFCHNIDSIRQDIVRPIVKEFVMDIFNREGLTSSFTDHTVLDINQTKWELTIKHIAYVQNKDDLEAKMELTKYILEKCVTNFNSDNKDNGYVARRVCFDFIEKFRNCCYEFSFKYNDYVNVIFEKVLEILQALPAEDIYIPVWKIRTDILARKAICEGQAKLSVITDTAEKQAVHTDIVKSFGKDFGCLIEEYVKKDMYFGVLVQDIQSVFIRNVNSVACYVGNITYEDVLVLVSLALMESSLTEAHKLALEIVPQDYDKFYKQEYDAVINKFKELESLEIKCKMCEKFVNSHLTAAFM